jgi:outer membrane receptor protein involved in Fe transport
MKRATALIALAMAPAAHAQDLPQPAQPPAAGEERVAYDAAFYAQFSPRTALDMVGRTPGFTLAEGAERRGFSGAVGNVLIDGERAIAKSQTLADILQRIPAAQVVRIELLRGAQTAGDASGFAVLANVVRTHSAGGGAWSIGYEIAQQHAPAPNGFMAWNGRIGTTDYGLGLNGYSFLRELPGDREIVDGSGAPIATRTEESPRSFFEIAVNGEAGRQMLGGRMRLTGQAYRSRYHQDNALLTFSPAGTRTERELDPFTENKRTLETGLEHERRLGGWDLNLAALLTRTRYDSAVESLRSDADDAFVSRFTQTIERENGETILRATLARDLSPRHRLEAGIEGALNTQDQALVLTFDFGTGPIPISVPNSNLNVEELRGDAYVVHTWRPDSRWSLETRLAGEVSKLSFSGDASQSVSLSYLKPSFQVTRGLGGQNQLRARLFRDVSQLDFTDFVSRASLSDDIIEGGNPDLRPQTSWQAEVAADLRFGGQGALSVTAFRQWISDTVDLVTLGPPGARFDAPGNIGDARVWGLDVSLTLPLQRILTGGSLTVDGTWRDARVTDPLTGERRIISDFEEDELTVEFRQDLTARRFAWGLKYEVESAESLFRFNEIDRSRDAPNLEAWIETTAIQPLKLRLTLVSLLTTPERRERTFFTPHRTGAVDRIERSAQHPGQWLLMSVSGNF